MHMLTDPSFHPLPALRAGPDLKCLWVNCLITVTVLKSLRSEGLKEGCRTMSWIRLLTPVGVSPPPVVIQAKIRSSEGFCESARGLPSDSVVSTNTKPDPTDWGMAGGRQVSTKMSRLQGL